MCNAASYHFAAIATALAKCLHVPSNATILTFRDLGLRAGWLQWLPCIVDQFWVWVGQLALCLPGRLDY